MDLGLLTAADKALTLWFDPSWYHNWPRPPRIKPDSLNTSIVVSKGFVVLDSWKLLSESPNACDAVARTAWHRLAIDHILEDESKVPVGKFLCRLAAAEGYRHLLAQMVVGVADLLETTWLTAATSADAQESSCFD